MNFQLKSKRNLVIIIAGIAIILGLLLPIKISDYIAASGKLIPAKEWIISRNTDGRLTAVLTDNKLGKHLRYFSTIFERGDAVQISFKDKVSAGASVAIDDTIGCVSSNNFDRAFIQLQSQLAERRNELQLYLTGEKEAVREQALGQLSAAKIQADMQHGILQRKAELFKNHLISREEYEVEQAKADLYDKNAVVAQAQLNVVQSGAKSEQIRLIQSQVDGLEKEIAVVGQRLNESWLIAPLNGMVARTFSTDTLLLVQNTDEFILIMPVNWLQKDKISIGQEVELEISGSKQRMQAQMIGVGKTVQSLNGRQFIWATAVVSNAEDLLAAGLIVQAKIHCADLTFRSYLFNFIKSIYIG